MIELRNISKIYREKEREVRALDNVTLKIDAGEFVVVRGASGSGKTTLLLALGGMLKPTSGYLSIDGEEIYSKSEGERNRFRATKVGFVFQMFHLLPYLTVLENVTIASVNKQKAEAEKLLSEFGLGERLTHKPFALSAGEKQRTAVARALINDPKILLADEPTGNLDPDNAEEIMKSFEKFHKNGGTVVLVTHGNEADKYADRIIKLKEGKLVGTHGRVFL
jgi:putative ABC transport system ATP-binding protein